MANDILELKQFNLADSSSIFNCMQVMLDFDGMACHLNMPLFECETLPVRNTLRVSDVRLFRLIDFHFMLSHTEPIFGSNNNNDMKKPTLYIYNLIAMILNNFPIRLCNHNRKP